MIKLNPENITNMGDLRAGVDDIDRQISALLGRRATLINRATEIKYLAGLPPRITERVNEVLDNARTNASASGVDPELAHQLWTLIVEWSIEHESKLMNQKRQ